MRALLTLLAACAVSLGCEQPKLPKSWRLTYTRVLAVRSEVVGDEARATPEPGERLRVKVLIVGDQPVEELSYALVVCPAAPPNGEVSRCAGEPALSERGELRAGQLSLWRELIVELDVSDESALEGAERLHVGGTICTDGSAELGEGGEGRCVDGDAQPVTFTAHIALALDDSDQNQNPVLSEDAIRFDDEVWSPYALGQLPSDEDAGAEADAGAAAGESIAARADGEKHTIAVSLEDAGRETSEQGPEELLLSHYVTAGVLERRFSVLERDQDGREPMRIKWHMPRVDEPPARLLAVFVLRDQRGGVAYALRELEID